MVDQPAILDANFPVPLEDETPDDGRDPEFYLGSPARDVYQVLAGANRQQVIDMGRQMAELTIPSVLPPLNYRTGDELPGNNQSIGARAVNNLASKLMFMAFPPGQPMLKFVPEEQKLQKEIDQDPELYDRIQLALSRREIAHRVEAAVINLATPYIGYIKLLLVSGNALWKHISLAHPTFHNLQSYACSRDMNGHPLLTIHEEQVRTASLAKDIAAQIYAESPELLKEQEWSREAKIYSVCRLCRDAEDSDRTDWHWEYWQETEKGAFIEGTQLDVDYDNCPMWPGWIIPVYGQNYGRSYCEEYRGDLYILESNASAINDGAAQASLALTFVKPGGRTSLRQVQQAKNLSFLSGSAEDMTVFKAEKGADFQFVQNNLDKAAQRIGQAFLVMAAVMRQGERVTAEEVQRTGQDLDQAMGGVYTQLAQGNQRVMVSRFVHLHEESSDAIPPLPQGLVRMELVTGVDAMGRSADVANLSEFGKDMQAVFPQLVQTILDPEDYATRMATARGIKPEGLVKSQQQLDQEKQQQQQQAQGAEMTSKAIAGASGPIAKGMMDRLPPSAAQQQQQQQGAPPPNGA